MDTHQQTTRTDLLHKLQSANVAYIPFDVYFFFNKQWNSLIVITTWLTIDIFSLIISSGVFIDNCLSDRMCKVVCQKTTQFYKKFAWTVRTDVTGVCVYTVWNSMFYFNLISVF